MGTKRKTARWVISAALVFVACGPDSDDTVDRSVPVDGRPEDTDTTIDPPVEPRVEPPDGPGTEVPRTEPPSTEPPEIDEIDGIGECFVNVGATVAVDPNAESEDAAALIEGVPVALFAPWNPNEPEHSGYTASDGRVEFDFILAGECDLSGFVLTLTGVPDGYMAPTIAVDLGDSGDSEFLFPLIPKPELGAGSGADPCHAGAEVTVWEDVDGDGVWDPDELPMRGVAVGFIGAGAERPSYDLRPTGYDGRAELGFVLGGPEECDRVGHRIGVIHPPIGFLASEVDLEVPADGDTAAISMGLVAGTTPDPDPRPCYRNVLGRVWEDRNADGVRSADEPWLEGVWVAARWPDGGYGPKDSARTSAHGVAHIEFSLRRGDCELEGHSLDVRAPAGYLPPAGTVPLVDGDDDGATVIVEVGLVPDPDRGPQPEGAVGPGECFRGLVIEAFADVDDDGRPDPGEFPLFRVAAVVARPDQELTEAVAETMVDTTPQGYAEIGVVVDDPDCDLTGYSLLIVRAPMGTDLPANPIIDLGAVDTGDDPLVIEVGLPLRRRR